MKRYDQGAPSSLGEAISASLPDCQTCGACCSFSAEWPRFTLEADEDLAQLPNEFVDGARNRMRCHGDRCSALAGSVGVSTSCRVYDRRPDVCRSCEPGDDACGIARQYFNLKTYISNS